jgi:DNA-binding MarR family transcriptional regulator
VCLPLAVVSSTDAQPQAAQIAVSPERLHDLILAVSRAANSACVGAARSVGLAGSDLAALSRLANAGEMTGAELGRILQLTASAVSELADRLEAAGMITRARSRQDRRLTMLKATVKGRRTARAALAPLHTTLAEIIAAQSPTQLRRSVELLLELSSALTAVKHTD